VHDLALPFVLLLQGEATPDLSMMSAPVRIPIWLYRDHQPGQADSPNLPTAKDDAND
jgi:hypothetical protein